jgi:2'-5' RNA ligase
LAAARVPLRSAPAFAPHLTVLRNVRKPLSTTPTVPLHWPVREFVLIDSVSGPQPAYRLLGYWPLRKR